MVGATIANVADATATVVEETTNMVSAQLSMIAAATPVLRKFVKTEIHRLTE
jgi:hypothetical protein